MTFETGAVLEFGVAVAPSGVTRGRFRTVISALPNIRRLIDSIAGLLALLLALWRVFGVPLTSAHAA